MFDSHFSSMLGKDVMVIAGMFSWTIRLIKNSLIIVKQPYPPLAAYLITLSLLHSFKKFKDMKKQPHYILLSHLRKLKNYYFNIIKYLYPGFYMRKDKILSCTIYLIHVLIILDLFLTEVASVT